MVSRFSLLVAVVLAITGLSHQSEVVPNFYLGGSFQNVSTSQTSLPNSNNFVAIPMSQNQFTSLGSGTNEAVLALAKDNCGNIYLGGLFTTAGGVSVNGLAYYNAATGVYSAVGNFNYTGAAVTSLSTDCSVVSGCLCALYVAGAFSFVAQDGTATNVAVHDPSSNYWYSLGGISAHGLSSQLTVISKDYTTNQLYVGGAFSTLIINAQIGNAYAATWNTTFGLTTVTTGTDYGLESPVVAIVYDMVVAPGIGVYFGGNFKSDQCSFSCVFNTATKSFQPLSSSNPIVGNVYGVSFDNRSLIYMAGNFSTQKGDVSYVAMTTVSSTSVTGNGWSVAGVSLGLSAPAFAFKIKALDPSVYAYSSGSYAVTLPAGLAIFYDADVSDPFPFGVGSTQDSMFYYSILDVPVNGSGVLMANISLIMMCIFVFLFFVQ